jgi:CubicO group peptidase (beta-lactamase class C family)
MPNTLVVSVVVWAGAVAGASAQARAAPPSDLDSYVERVMRTFEVPGAAVAIVKDGHVVVAKGYGVRKLGDRTPIDAQTRFGIASNTKAFTATALALLVEAGEMDWDAPVIHYVPWFQMYDPYVTRELTVRDLLVHRSGLGLGAGDLLWWPPSTYDRHEIIRRLRYLKPEASFRAEYAYDNVLYLVAGEVIEAVSGRSWEDFVTARVLRPVGMAGTTLIQRGAARGANIAMTHGRINGRVRAISPFDASAANPAAGIVSNAEDMAKWMMVQLDSGRLADGGTLFEPFTARELWSTVTPISSAHTPAELAPLRSSFNGYGLGFGVRDYRGEKLVTHTGALPGYVSRVALIPDRRLGVTVLTNQESGAAFDAITWHVLDYYLGARPFDWVTGYQRVESRQDSIVSAALAVALKGRDPASRPSLPLSRYAGAYTDAWYGHVMIERERDGLVIRFAHTPALLGDLEHWQYDTFIARWRNPELRADAYVTFALNPDGSIERITMAPVSPATDFSFDFQDLLLRPARMPAR